MRKGPTGVVGPFRMSNGNLIRTGENQGSTAAGGVVGQVIRICPPCSPAVTSTSSTRPLMTARPISSSSVSVSWSSPRAPGARSPGAERGASSPTSMKNCFSSSISSTWTGAVMPPLWCSPTARVQASPTASLTSSRTASSTPDLRATAAATSRAVLTCSGSALKRSSTVAMRPPRNYGRAVGGPGRRKPGPLLLLLPTSCCRPGHGPGNGAVGRRHRFLDRGVDREHLGEAGDTKDLENALLVADQAQRALMGTHPLQSADQYAEPGGVEEVHALHVDDKVETAVIHQLDQLFAQLGRGIYVDFATDPDDRAIADGLGRQGQVHGSSSTLLSSGRPLGHLGRAPWTVRQPRWHSITYGRRARRLGPIVRHASDTLGADGQESPIRSNPDGPRVPPLAGR